MAYLFEGELGTGPDGPVRRAIDERLGARPVAARILNLDDDGIVHLRRHAEALAGVGHRHLGLITDVTRVDDGVLVATTLGVETLAQRTARRPLSVDEVLSVVGSTASALAAAHRAALPHGSVHADNVVWAAEPDIDRPAGVPVLVDLGLGAFRGEPADRVDPALWQCDRRAMIALARALLEPLGPPSTTRASALVELVAGRSEELVERTDGLAVLAQECERISHRPDVPLPTPRPVTSAPLRPRGDTAHRGRRGAHRRPRPPVGLDGRRLLTGAALAAGLVGGVTVSFAIGRSADTDEATPAAHLPIAECGPEAGVPTPPPGGEPVSGFVDLDADGCPDAVWWSPVDATLHVMTDPSAGNADRFRLGSPGDELVVGDWDCDGTTTPGLYRPASGETFHFDVWASTDAPVEASRGPVLASDATPQVDGSDDHCDRIIVTAGRR